MTTDNSKEAHTQTHPALKIAGFAVILLMVLTSSLWLIDNLGGDGQMGLPSGLSLGLFLATIGIGVIQVCHLTGLWDWPQWRKRQPAVAVLLAAAILQTLVVERLGTLEQIERHLQESRLDALDSLRHELDPTMDAIFGDHIQTTSHMVKTAVVEKRVYLRDDMELFRTHYRKTLAAFPDRHLLATSLPSERYFWTESAMRMVEGFMAGGGKMSRVFFVSDQDLRDPEALKIMRRQCEMSVQVYVTDITSVSGEIVEFFLFDDKREFGWEVDTYPSGGGIKSITATTSRTQIDEYARMWNEILNAPSTVRLVRGGENTCIPPDPTKG